MSSADTDDMQPRRAEVKSGISVPHPYQMSSSGVHSVGTRTGDPSSHGTEFRGPGYHDSDSRKPGVDVGYRQFDHTTTDRGMVVVWLLIFVG